MATTVDKYFGNANGYIVDRFVKPRASTRFVYMAYSLDGPGQSIRLSGPHEEFFNIDFFGYV